MFARLSKLLTNHSGAVLIVSAIFLAVAGWFGIGVFDHLSGGGFASKDAESTQVQDILNGTFQNSNPSIVVLATPDNGQLVTTPQSQALQARLADIIRPHATNVNTYASTNLPEFISTDKKSAIITATLAGDESQKIQALKELRPKLESQSGLTVQIGGPVAVEEDINAQIEKDLVMAERISFVLLAVLLFIVFKGLVAGILPLLLGGFAILGAFLITLLLTRVIDISQYAINVITLLGLGLAVDYSLFVVSRFREELRRDNDVQRAVAHTIQTAGRTVFFSGITVIVSLLVMFIFPLPLLKSMALGGAAAVLAAMIGALFVLPAILQQLGRRVNWLSFGSARRDLQADKKAKPQKEKASLWYKTGTIFMRHPWPTLVATLALLLVAGAPFLRVHFIVADYRSLPATAQSREVSEKLATDFAGQSESLKLLYTTPNLTSTGLSGLYDYVQSLKQLPGVTEVDSIVSTPIPQGTKQAYRQFYATSTPQTRAVLGQMAAGDTTVVSVHYSGTSDSQTAQQLVPAVRDLRAPPGATVAVGGQAAMLYDLLATLKHYIPYGLALIMASIFIIFFLMLGSIIIPIKAILMNLLSLTVAFGALVWIFQQGHLSGLLNTVPQNGLDATIPVLIFCIAFGLSMDYSVFLYSRIKEEYDKNGGDNVRAVLSGLQKTGSIITSASVLLMVVVLAFATGKIPLMQQIGIGLAITVFVDAFLVRMVLVPATMRILGKSNWWAPGPLRWVQQKIGFKEY